MKSLFLCVSKPKHLLCMLFDLCSCPTGNLTVVCSALPSYGGKSLLCKRSAPHPIPHRVNTIRSAGLHHLHCQLRVTGSCWKPLKDNRDAPNVVYCTLNQSKLSFFFSNHTYVCNTVFFLFYYNRPCNETCTKFKHV